MEMITRLVRLSIVCLLVLVGVTCSTPFNPRQNSFLSFFRPSLSDRLENVIFDVIRDFREVVKNEIKNKDKPISTKKCNKRRRPSSNNFNSLDSAPTKGEPLLNFSFKDDCVLVSLGSQKIYGRCGQLPGAEGRQLENSRLEEVFQENAIEENFEKDLDVEAMEESGNYDFPFNEENKLSSMESLPFPQLSTHRVNSFLSHEPTFEDSSVFQRQNIYNNENTAHVHNLNYQPNNVPLNKVYKHNEQVPFRPPFATPNHHNAESHWRSQFEVPFPPSPAFNLSPRQWNDPIFPPHPPPAFPLPFPRVPFPPKDPYNFKPEFHPGSPNFLNLLHRTASHGTLFPPIVPNPLVLVAVTDEDSNKQTKKDPPIQLSEDSPVTLNEQPESTERSTTESFTTTTVSPTIN